MKKIVFYMGILFVIFFLISDLKTEASYEGTLKINTNTKKDKNLKGMNYIEQENDLSELFLLNTTNDINKIQIETKEKYQQYKNNLFINKLFSENIVDEYNSLLFNSQTSIKISNNQFELNSSPSNFSFPKLAILVTSVIIMMYFVVKIIIHRKERQNLWKDI